MSMNEGERKKERMKEQKKKGDNEDILDDTFVYSSAFSKEAARKERNVSSSFSSSPLLFSISHPFYSTDVPPFTFLFTPAFV